MVEDQRQAGELGADKALERIQRFCDDVADINKRWNDRFPLKGRSWAEGYVGGKLWIALQGKWALNNKKYTWFTCILAHCAVGKLEVAQSSVHGALSDCDCGNDEIVLVFNVEGLKAPPEVIPSVAFGPYLVEEKLFGPGEGNLHCPKPSGPYEILPIFRHGEVGLGCLVIGSDDACGQVVQCGSKIVNSISDYERQSFRNWYERFILERIAFGFCVGRDYVRLNAEPIKVTWDGLRKGDKLFDVLVGPFGFETRPKKHIGRDTVACNV